MRQKFWLLFFTLPLSACYSLKQAYWFNNAYNSRLPVASIVAAPSSPKSNFPRAKLALSREVLDYAKEEGLNTGGSYQHYIPEESAQVSYYVQAAYADRLESLTWWFPFVGRVPYLGFFNVNERDDMARTLRDQGYDVSVGAVGAFSSLGWFDDPIYASMTKRTDADFVQLLFHELVHRTFWSEGSVVFNENLAEFVSLKLTKSFLLEKKQGKGLEEFRAQQEDQEQLRIWLNNLKDSLSKVYSQEGLSRSERLELKAETIKKYRDELFPQMKTDTYAASRKRSWNNASILAASLYSPDTQRFSEALACLGVVDMGTFLDAIRSAEGKQGSAEKALSSICEGNRAQLKVPQ